VLVRALVESTNSEYAISHEGQRHKDKGCGRRPQSGAGGVCQVEGRAEVECEVDQDVVGCERCQEYEHEHAGSAKDPRVDQKVCKWHTKSFEQF